VIFVAGFIERLILIWFGLQLTKIIPSYGSNYLRINYLYLFLYSETLVNQYKKGVRFLSDQLKTQEKHLPRRLCYFAGKCCPIRFWLNQKIIYRGSKPEPSEFLKYCKSMRWF
jgi:hypothetical protein